jgi:vault protein inter-alpha-trypsin-like protein/VWA domain-containing protein/tetratricopeptide repeat protein
MRFVWLALALLPLALLTPGPAGAKDEPPPLHVAFIAEIEGRAYVRPAGRERFGLLARGTALRTGDLVRTAGRGAHAVELRLEGGGRLILGPGGQFGLRGVADIRLEQGDLEVVGSEKSPVTVLGPGGHESRIISTIHLRAGLREVTQLDEPPAWIVGFRSGRTTGSLVAKLDGRDTPLAVGRHSVDVVIRDQIARTTIDQTFINETDHVLEGTFTFPLPADASISGFAMWIGGRMIEADVVERHRAREIYEDIRRTRRDPGLLEWAGGNVFRASVFPVPARGEKRVRIRYTQVLPLTGDTYHYRYPLCSELLRARPLRELSIRISVHSASRIVAAACQSHPMRVRRAEQTTILEFDAQDVRPDRDLEATITLAQPVPLRIVHHRRGDDGYFMLLLAPPDPASGGWRRALPKEKPLDLVILADTSGSMDSAAREAQVEFIRGLLHLLGPSDTFRLLATDVTPVPIVGEPTSVTPLAIEFALAALAARDSLGWSDIERGVDEALRRAGDSTHVVYVGDGIPTSGKADTPSIARGLATRTAKATVHAVSTGATYEKAILEAMASIGCGSVRAAGTDPARTAHDLLTEVSLPVARDLRVRIEGVRTARVYPARLPNLPAGHQQTILGRYLPGDGPPRGTVTVAGTLDGKPIRLEAPFAACVSGESNSFLPRLWALRHLDALLTEKVTPALREEIVAFSQEFGIITPHTSLLVLESDADRVRYGVTRRLRMRDGETLFAEARDAASTEDRRRSMREARAWHSGQRRRALAEISGLGRPLQCRRLGFGLPDDDQPQFGMAPQPPSDAEIEDAFSAAGLPDDLGDLDLIDTDGGPPLDSAGAFEASYGDWPSGRPYSPAGLPEAPETQAIPRFPGEAGEILDRLSRLPSEMTGLITRTTREAYDSRSGRMRFRRRATAVVSPAGWHVSRVDGVGRMSGDWCAGGMRGVLDPGTRLGRRWAAAPEDLCARRHLPGLPGPDLDRWLVDGVATVESRDGSRVTIRIDLGTPARRIVADLERGVVLSEDVLYGTRVDWKRTHEGHEQVGGIWVPRLIKTVDGKGRLIERLLVESQHLEPAAAPRAIDALLAAHGDAVFFGRENATWQDARRAIRSGRASVSDHYTRAVELAWEGRLEEAGAAWRAVETLVGDKPGVVWLRAGFSLSARPGTEFLAWMRSAVGAAKDRDDAIGRHIRLLLHDLVSGYLQPDEELALTDALLTSERGASNGARRLLLWRRTLLLRECGRPVEVRATLRRLLDEDPDDSRGILAYLQELDRASDHPEAERVVRRVLAGAKRWEARTINEVCSRWANRLHQWERRTELIEFLDTWLAVIPDAGEAHRRRLSAMLGTARDDEARRLVSTWLADPTAPPGARWAAVRIALDEESVPDPAWMSLLEAIVERRLRHESDPENLFWTILQHKRFRAWPGHGRVVTTARNALAAPDAVATIGLDLLDRYISILTVEGDQLDPDFGHDVVNRLRKRWSETAIVRDRRSLGNLVVKLLYKIHDDEERLEFELLLLPEARAYERLDIARSAISARLGAPCGPSEEEEIFRMLPHLSGGGGPEDAVRSLLWITAQLLRTRVEVAVGETEGLTRALRRAQEGAARSDARRALADRLGVEAGRATEELRPWIELERLCFLAQEDHDPTELVEEAERILGEPVARSTRPLSAILRERLSLLASRAALSRNAPEDLPDRVLTLFRSLLADADLAPDARRFLARLLVALDRTETLEKELRSFVESAPLEGQWATALGALLTGSSRLTEAVEVLEGARRNGDLDDDGYVALADLLLVLGEDERRARAVAERWRVIPIARIPRMLLTVLEGEGYEHPVPPETFDAIAALLRRSPDPEEHLYPLALLRDRIDDPRALTALADAIIGHTPMAIYGLLESVGELLESTDSEADCDAVVTGLAKRMAEVERPADRRGLALLTVLVECRAAAVRNAPGPHADRARAVLEAARPESIGLAEAPLLATFLATLNPVEDPGLRAEQLRQLALCARALPAGSRARLRVSLDLARLRWLHGKRDGAMDILAAAVQEARAAHGGVLPDLPDARKALLTLVGWSIDRSRPRAAEGLLQAEGDRVLPDLGKLYVRCLRDGLAVSLGEGEVLYRKAGALLTEALDRVEPASMVGLLDAIRELHRTAGSECGFADAGRNLERFATGVIPERLPPRTTGAFALIGRCALDLRALRDGGVAMRYLIEQIEAEPEPRQRAKGSLTSSMSRRLAELRESAGDLADLEPRLLAIAKRVLRRELRSGRISPYSLHGARGTKYYWHGKTRDFADVAEAFIDANGDSPKAILVGAVYLADGLDQRHRAVEKLIAADRRKRLSPAGRRKLTEWLPRIGRPEEAIVHLEKLALASPTDDKIAAQLVRALHETGRDEDAVATVLRLRPNSEARRWWERRRLALLARTCLDCGLLETALALQQQLLSPALREWGLSENMAEWLTSLADILVRLGRFTEGLRAAGQAEVLPDLEAGDRGRVLEQLLGMLEGHEHLDSIGDAWVTAVQAGEPDSGVVRKALGLAHNRSFAAGKAVPHLRAALRLRSQDKDVHEALVKALTLSGEGKAAIAALRRFVMCAPDRLDLLPDLARRLEAAGQADEAERARTSLVEHSPDQVDGHRRLARTRKTQGWLDEEVEQWEHVVRVRPLDHEGWLALADSQIRAGRIDDARKAVEHLRRTDWKDASESVRHRVERLSERLPD